MIKVICDKCGKDCGLNAIDVSMGIIHNPCPTHVLDVDNLKITNDYSRIRFILCQDCSKELGLPNIYETVKTKELKFREYNDD